MDTVFFIASKLVWGLIRVESWIIIGLLLTVGGLWRNRLTLARRAAGLTLVIYLLIGFLPIGDLLLWPLEQRYPVPDLPAAVTGIIILGGAEEPALSRLWQQPVFNDAGERLTVGATLARRFPAAQVVYSGGSGALSDMGQQPKTSANVAAQVLTDLGIAPERLQLETASRNTAENARLSFSMVVPRDDEAWVLVTSAFHMPRAIGTFKAAGWPELIAYPVDFRSRPATQIVEWDPDENFRNFNLALREYVGLVAYKATGR